MLKKTGYPASEKQVKEILEKSNCRKETDFSNFYGFDIYIFDEEKVLFPHTNGTGVVYYNKKTIEDSIERLNEYRKQPCNVPNTQHILTKNFPYKDDFIGKIPYLIDKLPEKLFVEREILDNTINSLKKIDKAIKKVGQLKCLEEDIFPSLIAYVGEVIRCRANGKWQMRQVLQKSSTIWEPYIITEINKEHLPFALIYKELYENQPFSLAGAVAATIS